MLRITIELWPGGNERAKKMLGEVRISNVSGLAPMSDYIVDAFDDRKGRHVGSRITHMRKDGWWLLLKKAWEAIETRHPEFTRLNDDRKD